MAKKHDDEDVKVRPARPATAAHPIAAAHPIMASLDPPVNGFGANGYPLCMVPDSVNADHDGGGELGPLYLVESGSSDYSYVCSACSTKLSLFTGARFVYPPTGDGKSDFC